MLPVRPVTAPGLDLEEYEYEPSDVLKNVECPICRSILGDELSITHCGHTFCRPCLRGHTNTGNDTCPVCRDQIGTAKTNFALAGVLDGLLLKHSACGTIVKRSQRAAHAKECQEIVIPCISSCCSARVKRGNLSDHINACRFAQVLPPLEKLLEAQAARIAVIEAQATRITALEARVREQEERITALEEGAGEYIAGVETVTQRTDQQLAVLCERIAALEKASEGACRVPSPRPEPRMLPECHCVLKVQICRDCHSMPILS